MDDLYIIHLFLESDWWRMRNWSAYLYQQLTEAKQVEELGIIRRSDTIKTGLQEKSFKKFLKEIHPQTIDDKHLIINTKGLITLDNITLENYGDVLNEFILTFTDSEANSFKKQRRNNNDIPHSESIQPPVLMTNSDILKLCVFINKIADYPLSDKSMIDTIRFVESLKREVANLPRLLN